MSDHSTDKHEKRLIGRVTGRVTGRVVETVQPDIVLDHIDINALSTDRRQRARRTDRLNAHTHPTER